MASTRFGLPTASLVQVTQPVLVEIVASELSKSANWGAARAPATSNWLNVGPTPRIKIRFAADPEITIAKANKAYTEGFYANAAELYKSIINAGYESADLYYNLGNACYKQNDFTSSILYYEKALKLDPGNEDVNYNLNVANSRISDKIEPLPELFYRRWLNTLISQLSTDEWAKAGIACLIIAILLGTVYVASRVLILRKLGFWTGLSSFLLSLIFLLFALGSYTSVKSDLSAIVSNPTVTIKSSPDEKSTDIFVLHEGSKVRLIDHIGNWYEIKIANGSVGWLPSSAMEKI